MSVVETKASSSEPLNSCVCTYTYVSVRCKQKKQATVQPKGLRARQILYLFIYFFHTFNTHQCEPSQRGKVGLEMCGIWRFANFLEFHNATKIYTGGTEIKDFFIFFCLFFNVFYCQSLPKINEFQRNLLRNVIY